MVVMACSSLGLLRFDPSLHEIVFEAMQQQKRCRSLRELSRQLERQLARLEIDRVPDSHGIDSVQLILTAFPSWLVANLSMRYG